MNELKTHKCILYTLALRTVKYKFMYSRVMRYTRQYHMDTLTC